MAILWRNVRIPAELYSRLESMARDLEWNHVEGKAPLPSEFVEAVPLYFVIQKAFDEMEAHRIRSRAKKRRKAKHESRRPQGS